MGDDFAKWLLRIVGVIGLIAFGTAYAVRHDWSKGWMPSASPDYAPPAASAPEAVAAAPPAAQVQAPAVTATAPAAAPPAAALSTTVTEAPAVVRASSPCQPIGRTAKGELVYSMDCRSLPAP
ncbi:hypothetical protein [Rhodopseudomonas palustris]|uniref:Uncharacterized protein n=1 Tax=Rhodopseudomonas palustris TaxID=1076 RepID=A0A418V2M9_RHOPL|nr:hypothetical protein [Rhodopseudomonas palustris]RJF70332.1 hypothetical protein D4Q52_17390 [Rhodopseudomonas palustris]